MKIDYAIDVWPKGSRHFRIATHTSIGGTCREIDISLGKYQLLISIASSIGVEVTPLPSAP
jgi:hypothetical protein